MSRRRLSGTLTGVIALAALQLALASYAVAAPLAVRPQIAITFDDAPLDVGPLLETLEQKGATATFFLVGQDAEANPSQAEAIASAGMLIGSHSYDHAHLATATADAIRANLTLAQEAIEEQTGVTPRWYRSPYLDQNPLYDTVLPELGLTASWPTINPKDWSGPTPQQIIDIVLDQAAPGGVVILHDMDNRTNTIEALPGLIDGLRAAGYGLVTLDDIGRGAIEGTLTLSGSPTVSGAVATAYDSDGTAIATTSVDKDGSYRLARLAPGSYRIGVVAADHIPGYYGGVGGLANAEPITVAADHTIAGADVTLEVLINDPPMAVADSYSGPEDEPLVVLAPGVLGNDTGVDDSLTAALFSAPRWGTLLLAAEGSFMYMPNHGFSGSDSFTYCAFDGEMYSTPATVSIEVTSVNDAPIAKADGPYSTPEDTEFVLPAPGVLSNDTDEDGDALTAVKATDPAHGTLALAADGSFIYTPAPGYHGADSFTYKVNDGLVDSTPVTVPIDVTSVNDAPVATADGPYTTLEDTVLAKDAASGVLSNDTDADGDELIAQLVGDVSYGTLALAADGSLSYTPAPGYHGADSFTYRVFDGGTYSNTVTVSLNVTEKPAATLVAGFGSATNTRRELVVGYGTSATLVGKLADAGGACLSGKAVIVERYDYALRTWIKFGNAFAGATAGEYRYTARAYAASRTPLRMRFADDSYNTGSVSAARTLMPKSYVRTPIAPSTMRRSRYHSVYGYLKPRHTAGTYPVRIYKWKKTSSGRWKSYGYVNAKAYNYSSYTKYLRKIRLTSKGKWRLRAYTPKDGQHAATWSSGYDYVRVR